MTSQAPEVISDEIVVVAPSCPTVDKSSGTDNVRTAALRELRTAFAESGILFFRLGTDEKEDVHPFVLSEYKTVNGLECHEITRGTEFHKDEHDPGADRWLSLFSRVEDDRKIQISEGLLSIATAHWLCEHSDKLCLWPHRATPVSAQGQRRLPSSHFTHILEHIMEPSTRFDTSVELLYSVEAMTGNPPTAVRNAWASTHDGAAVPDRYTVRPLPTITSMFEPS